MSRVHSTRSNSETTISKAILQGLADDRGLFVFDDIRRIDVADLMDKDYRGMAMAVLGPYLDEFCAEDVRKAVDEAYGKFDAPDAVKVRKFEDYSFLELFHGPTAAFKDIALTLLPKLLVLCKKANGITAPTRVLVATSGDTGSATLSGFAGTEGIDVTVLYPDGLVSDFQEKQMLYYSDSVSQARAYAGNFDDCQNIVKEMSVQYGLSSANSINIGRLLPQIVYYFYSYVDLVKAGKVRLGEMINVSVPTGNFGDILAGYLAKRMGLPVNRLICAVNENRVLYDFINTGRYDRNRSFRKTYSPSMDILVSSNVERLLYYHYGDCAKVKELYDGFAKTGVMEIADYKELFDGFSSYWTSNDGIIENIKAEKESHGYLIDPHTAVARDAAVRYAADSRDGLHTLVLSTASPYKFEAAVRDCGYNLDFDNAPANIRRILDCKKTKNPVTRAQLEEKYSR